MERESVSSSLLESVGYDPAEDVLEVELESGSVYQYRDVPEETAEELLAADSLGRYFTHHIRDRSYVQIR